MIMNDQRSTYDQLRDLVQLANEHGLHDAADAVQRLVDRYHAKEMTAQEQMVYAAAYARAYTDTYPAYDHCIAAARAVKAARDAAEALGVMHKLLAMNKEGFDREVALIAKEFETSRRVKTSGKHVDVPASTVALFDRFMK